MRSILLKSLLVLALLFAQQGAVTHSISHAIAGHTHDQSLPHDQQCELCAAYAQVGSAVGCSDVYFDPVASFSEAHPQTAFVFHSIAFAAFAARAPPYSA